jgi:hypothetical protein
MKKSWAILEILVGLLVLITAIITLYPFKFFNIQTGAGIMAYGTVISALILLIVGVFLAIVFSYKSSSLAKKINVVTSVLVIFTAVALLYFQLFAIGQLWLHLFFGVGLLSYGVGRVVFGALTVENNFGLRVFNSAIGIAIGVLSIVVILFQMVLVSSSLGVYVYYTYGYFTRVAFVLIGVDCLVSAMLGMFFNRQKQEFVRKRE